MNENQVEFKKTQFYIVWGALLSSIFIYAGVLYMVEVQLSSDPSLVETLTMAFIGIASLEAVAAFAISRRMLKEEVLQGLMAKNSDTESFRSNALQQYFMHSIISWVLAESIAIFGLILGFLSANPENGLPFIATSAVLFLALIPQPDKLTEKLGRLQPMPSYD